MIRDFLVEYPVLISNTVSGEERYQDYLELYERIRDFVNSEPLSRTVEEAHEIFISILNHNWADKKVPYNRDHWEKRALTKEELRMLAGAMKPKEIRKLEKTNKKFWAIKKAKPMSLLSCQRRSVSLLSSGMESRTPFYYPEAPTDDQFEDSDEQEPVRADFWYPPQPEQNSSNIGVLSLVAGLVAIGAIFMAFRST